MKAKTHKWIAVGIFSAAALFGVIMVAAMAALNSDGGGLPFRKVAAIRIDGVITESAWHVRTLRELLADNSVAGVLLRIDSPGGAVAPSQELYNAVAAYKNAGKPLVVSMGNVAASGGYYVAAPAHKIFASPGTLTGSIGVIFTLPIYQDLAKKVGVDFRVLKAGDLKDMGSPYRPMTEIEAQTLQSLLDDTHEQFISDVADGRGAEPEDIKTLADGRIFTGKQALENNLVDTLGGYEDALSYLKAICGVSESARALEKRQNAGWRELLAETAQKNIPGLGALSRPAGMYYLFVP
jgi:protease-4